VAQADALRAAGDAAGARAALRRANDLTANPDGHLIRRAWVASEDGDIYGAITHARRLLELHPAGGVAAWMYARQVVGTDAEPLFRRDAERALARLHPGDGPLDFLAASYHLLSEEDRADALMQAGRGRDCVQARDVASRSNCEAWYRALAGRELDAARTAIDAALVDHPNRTEFLDTKAVVLEAQGDLEAARDAAWHAAALAPDDVYLLWQAARLDAATRTGG
jgi:tetratricopeptide (TPR) repeat protein